MRLSFLRLTDAINDIFRKNKQVHQYNKRQKKNDLHLVKMNTKLYGEKTIFFKVLTIGISYPTTLKK